MKMLLGLFLTTSMILLNTVYSYSDVQENLNEVMPGTTYGSSESDVTNPKLDVSDILGEISPDVDEPQTEDKDESDNIILPSPPDNQIQAPDNPPPLAQTREPDAYAVTVTRADSSNSLFIRYTQSGLAGSEVRLYTFDGMNYTILSSQIAYNDEVEFAISDFTTFDRITGGFYISLTESGLVESNKVMIPYEPIPELDDSSSKVEIRARLTSAIDDAPFDAIFDPLTGRISMIDLNGVEIGYRFVEDEAAFWALVEINAEVTGQSSQSFGRRFTTDRVNRNVSMIDVERELLIEFDENGVMTETPLDSSHWEQYGNSRAFTKQNENLVDNTRAYFEQFDLDAWSIEPNYDQYPELLEEPLYHLEIDEMELSFEERDKFMEELDERILNQELMKPGEQLGELIANYSFDTGIVYQYVPYAPSPSPSNGSTFVGGGYFYTSPSTQGVHLMTYGFPYGMYSLDVYFTNLIGDDVYTVFNVGTYRDIYKNVVYKGEAYGARVCSGNGSFSNVQLRFFTQDAFVQQSPTITFPSFNYQQVNVNQTLYATWNWVAGANHIVTLYNLTTGQNFGGHPAGSASGIYIDRGYFTNGHLYKITVAAATASQTTWGERLFYATVPVNPPVISNPSFDGQLVKKADLYTGWSWATNTTYTFSLYNLTTNISWINQGVGTASGFTVPQYYLQSGHQYRIAVSATSGGQTETRYRTFKVASSINMQLYLDNPFNGSVTQYATSVANNAKGLFYSTYGIDFNIYPVNTGIRLKSNCSILHPGTFLCPTLGHYDWTPELYAPNLVRAINCKDHSSSAYYLWQLTKATGSGMSSLFTQGYICMYDLTRGGEHNTQIGGMAPWPNYGGDSSIKGNVSVVGLDGNNYLKDTRIAQHEWSHNFGVSDYDYGIRQGECVWYQKCIMRRDFYETPDHLLSDRLWCDNCYAKISANSAIHSN